MITESQIHKAMSMILSQTSTGRHIVDAIESSIDSMQCEYKLDGYAVKQLRQEILDRISAQIEEA